MGDRLDQSDIVGPSDVLMPGSQAFLLAVSAVVGILALVTLVVVLVLRIRRRRRGGTVRRPVVPATAAVLAAASLVVFLWNRPGPFFVPEFPALPRLFPEEAFFHRTVADLPVHPDSPRMVAALDDLPVTMGAAGEVRGGIVWGKPFNLVDPSTPRHDFTFTYPAGSDDVAYPISDPAYIQSMPSTGIDDHYVALDAANQRMWELWGIRNWFGRWRAGSGAAWDLTTLDYPAGRTTASGFPLFPMAVTYAEVAGGRVDHALFVAHPRVGPDAVWPARASDGVGDDPDSPPMGSWLRLRGDADLSKLGPQALVLARAMRDHGMLLGDTGGVFAVSGTPDARWDDDDLRTLQTLGADDFEVLDASGLMVREDSMEARPTG